MTEGHLWMVLKLPNYSTLHFYLIRIRIMLDMDLQHVKPVT